MSSEEPETQATGKKKSLRRQVEELQQQLVKEREMAEDYLNRLKYLQAEFENFRKRTDKSVHDAILEGNSKLIAKLLIVMDNLEKALEAGREQVDAKAILTGVELVLRDLREILRNEGVREIEAVGRTFDPNLHDAVRCVETADVAENTVVKELRKGYLIESKVIRPSLVEIAKQPELTHSNKEPPTPDNT